MTKFGFPATVLKHYTHWSILLRPQQVTLGAMVLVCRESATAFADLSLSAFGELKQVTLEATNTLKATFLPDKFNYLMLMMVDPDVHFHLLPRYAETREFENHVFTDPHWPKPIDLTLPVASHPALPAIADFLLSKWKS